MIFKNNNTFPQVVILNIINFLDDKDLANIEISLPNENHRSTIIRGFKIKYDMLNWNKKFKGKYEWITKRNIKYDNMILDSIAVTFEEFSLNLKHLKITTSIKNVYFGKLSKMFILNKDLLSFTCLTNIKYIGNFTLNSLLELHIEKCDDLPIFIEILHKNGNRCLKSITYIEPLDCTSMVKILKLYPILDNIKFNETCSSLNIGIFDYILTKCDIKSVDLDKTVSTYYMVKYNITCNIIKLDIDLHDIVEMIKFLPSLEYLFVKSQIFSYKHLFILLQIILEHPNLKYLNFKNRWPHNRGIYFSIINVDYYETGEVSRSNRFPNLPVVRFTIIKQ